MALCYTRAMRSARPHRPLRFHFATFTVAGRRPVLGALEGAQVRRSPLGERVAKAWWTLGARFPGAIASTYCVMPDHFHGLLIVDIGRCAAKAAEILEAFRMETGPDLWAEARPFVITPFESVSLRNVRKYIRTNPARAAWKAAHADRFVRYVGHRAGVLPEEAVWTAFGNLTLLSSPFLRFMKISMHQPLDAIRARIDDFLGMARCGHVLVSGFVSPAERAVLDALREEGAGPYIRLLPYGIPRGFDPSVELSREIAERGALLLSPFPETVPYGQVTRARCVEINRLGAKIAPGW